MTEQDFKRKLTAILSADVKGYSQLMRDSEEETVRTITTYREVIGSVVRKHRGEVVDSPGDNILAEFASVVDAVRSAVEVQEELKARNAELPENRRMEFRIGINLGDVIHEKERIYGDGVNVAARVESLADAGGICVSRSAYDQVKDKLTLGYEYLGEHSVKNIAEPVRIYSVLMDPEAAGKVIGEKRVEPKRGQRVVLAVVIVLLLVVGGLLIWRTASPPIEVASVEKMVFPLPDKPSIAVLPFDNMSGKPEQEYFSDGLTEQIITNLSKLPNLFVIARNSTFTYKGKPVKVKQVSEELGVRYVLEGSVHKSDDRVRITAQLVDAITGHHLWAERYDRDVGDVFALQDEITKKILTALEVKLTRGESARISARNTDNIDAYLLFLQAVHHQGKTHQEGNIMARKLCEEAIVLDPNFADPYRLLAWTHVWDLWFGWSKSPRESFKKAVELAEQSLALDNTNAHTVALVGHMSLLKRQHEKAIAEGERSIDLAPNAANNYQLLAGTLRFSGRAAEGIPLLKKAIRLEPYTPANFYYQLGMAYNFTGQYDEAIAVLKKALKRTPDHLLSLLGLTIAYSLADRMEEARATAAEVLRVNPKLSVAHMEKTAPYKNKADLDLIMGAMRKAGLPDKPPLQLPDKPSIAVLPFDNMSEDPKQEYFADGMSDDLITDLSKISGLLVIARNSTFTYKGKAVKVSQIAQELGVRYVLEGSVRRVGNEVRINAQLIDSTTGGHLWAERYDGRMDDIFALQDKITGQIVNALAVKLTTDEEKRFELKETISIEAYDAFLQGWEHYLRQTPDDFAKALSYFKKAIELDPNYGRAYAALSLTYWNGATFGWARSMGVSSYTVARIRARHYLDIAMKNPTSIAHLVKFWMVYYRRNYQEAFAQARQAIALDPNNAEGYMALARILISTGRPQEAIDSVKKAMKLDPRNIANSLSHLGNAHFCMGQFQEAVNLIERALKLNPKLTGLGGTLAAAYAHLGRDQEARAALDIYRKGWGTLAANLNLQLVMYFFPYKNAEDADRFADGLLKAGLPGKPSGYYKVSEEHKLTGEEIKSLFFGRKMTGFFRKKQWWIDRTKDGEATYRFGSKLLGIGKSWVEGDELCNQWQEKKLYDGLKYCMNVFRNPEGTPEEKNDYFSVTDWRIYPNSLED